MYDTNYDSSFINITFWMIIIKFTWDSTQRNNKYEVEDRHISVNY